MRLLARTIALFFGWSLAGGVALLAFPGATGAPLVFLFFCLFMAGTAGVRPGPRTLRRRLRLRLRPPRREAWRWTAAAAPVLLVGAAALSATWAGLVEVPTEDANPFVPLLGEPGRRLAVAVYVIAAAPLIEEVVFRGALQRALERRLRAPVAIPLAAAVFALAHLLPRVAPVLLVLGAALGWVAWATRSLWPAVALHAVHNAVSYAALVLWGEGETAPTVWAAGPTVEWWTALAVLAAACALAVPLGRRLRQAGRPRRGATARDAGRAPPG